MDGRYRGGVVAVGGDARQRFYDARGYGRPIDGGLALAPVEAAHLLYRGDLDAVLATREGSVERLGFRDFLAAGASGFVGRFLVYKDLRDRGFYLSPVPAPRTDLAVDADATPAAVGDGLGAGRGRAEADARADAGTDADAADGSAGGAHDFAVYPRGKGPWDDEVRYRVRAVGERGTVAAAALGDVVLAVVDEESEITFLETSVLEPGGSADPAVPDATGRLLEDGVLVWEPPAALHEGGFYGQPFDDREDTDGALVLSLVEAASLAARGSLALSAPGPGEPAEPAAAEEALEAIVETGRAVEGQRFDRRLRAYRALREAGLVPKTGFKFGADFRVYREFDGLDQLGHSAYLVRVLPPGHVFSPRDLALDVRLAGGVRKRMVFARPGGGALSWVAVERLTP